MRAESFSTTPLFCLRVTIVWYQIYQWYIFSQTFKGGHRHSNHWLSVKVLHVHHGHHEKLNLQNQPVMEHLKWRPPSWATRPLPPLTRPKLGNQLDPSPSAYFLFFLQKMTQLAVFWAACIAGQRSTDNWMTERKLSPISFVIVICSK